ncbi:MAG: HTH domain-containing protein [Myxococcota bacterium]|nr:HTH domain-containing protein [Myxococcota bacterium]
MTFYEAALRVLESEGRPLHFLEITQKSITENLLSHVGKTPEQTMLSRLAAMARRARDRRVCVTAKDTFALIEWGVPEDVEALSQTGIPDPNPEEDLPPLRPVERHPESRNDNARASGRTERDRKGGRRDEEEGGRRRKKFPPIAEVVFEILSEVGQPLRPDDIANRAREKELASDELRAERILTALLEDNQKRIDAGRRPQFSLDKASGQISLERAGAPSEALPVELVAAFAEALGIPLEGGRPIFPARGAAAPVGAPLALAADGTVETALATAKTAIKEYRRAVAKILRKRLGELDGGTLEKSVVRMLHAHGFRELKVAKRSKEGPLLTARRRDGSVELRYAVRILRGNPALDRKEVKELRKDLQNYAGQVGLLCSAGEVRSDARTEAQQTQGGMVLLWCGDALADKFLDAQAAVKVTTVEMFEIDEAFFALAHSDAEEAARRREERHREKVQREGSPERPGQSSTEEASEENGEENGAAEVQPPRRSEPAPQQAAVPQRDEEGDDEEGDDDPDEHLDAASAFVAGELPGAADAGGEGGQAGDRKRRRRRRRGRRGRNPAAPGEGGTAPVPGAPVSAAPASGEAGAAPPASPEGSPQASSEAPAQASTEAWPQSAAEPRPAPEAVQSPAPVVEETPAAPGPDTSEGSTAGS